MKDSIAIRPIRSADAGAFITAARNSRKLHHPWVAPPSDAEAFARHLQRFDGVNNLGFVVYLPATSALVGSINLSNIVYGSFCSGCLGYYVFAGFERQGLMKAGLSAVIRYAFNQIRLHRLEANIQPGNRASLALVQSCGFQQEGYSPAYLKIGGRWRDHERWALLRGRQLRP